MMSEVKTTQNDASVTAFLDSILDEKRRKDSYTVLDLMKKATGLEPKIWGDAIVGFGSQHYQYASGREGDMPLTGFSPRKQALTLYIMGGFDQYLSLLERLGKYKLGKACLYIKRLSDIDLDVLAELVAQSIQKQPPQQGS
jgi:hypothetical protein